MRYVAAYLLATLGGNASPSLKDIKAILASVGIDCDDAMAQTVIKNLAGKDVNEVIAAGSSKLASVPSGGAAPAAAAPAAAAEEKKEVKKEEEKEEEESDDDMGFGLFD
ncbi:large ribosomal subunit protein P2-like [Sycon ciliatum]|uniref:Large ribosomal subunit protein P2 n=1 Tax=Sycon ciliatum TaxID=27933 RepID=M1XYC1_9METZ|nr:60S acidic ribosomal protein P2 [Sycon ciliatum]|eukprot:scpid51894/ scgid22748/ 60S acidic ribosomal protein P2